MAILRAAGGAIYNWGALDIDRCTFSENNALQGGAIWSSVAAGGEWQVTRSTFYQNSAAIHGGAISHGNGTANVTNCTLTGNIAPVGSAIISTSGWTVNVNYCTIAGNSNSTEGSIHNQSGVIALSSTIVADSEGGPNCSGTIRGGQDYFGEGHNIDSGSSCGWGANRGSMSNTDPLLLPLANNGGATDTMAIRAGSPAINSADATNCATVATDQRGFSRPVGPACDIGAFELPAGLPFINLLLDE